MDHPGIESRIAFANEVIIHDLSTGGVSLTADRRLKMGEKYLLKLQNNGNLIQIKVVVI